MTEWWSPARLVVYVTAIVVGIASVLSLTGLATYDGAKGTIDIHPISVTTIIGLITPIASSILAALANLFKWGRK